MGMGDCCIHLRGGHYNNISIDLRLAAVLFGKHVSFYRDPELAVHIDFANGLTGILLSQAGIKIYFTSSTQLLS